VSLLSLLIKNKQMKILQGIVVGALLSGFLAAIAGTYIALTSGETGVLGIKARDFWWFGLILGGMIGAITGSIVGGTISALNSNFIQGGGLVLLIAVFPTLFFYFFSDSKFDRDSIKFGVSLIFILVITGVLVPLITSWIGRTKL
jgi:hypothetical protein